MNTKEFIEKASEMILSHVEADDKAIVQCVWLGYVLGNIKVERFDVDIQKERMLFHKFHVRSIPTLMLVDGDTTLWSRSGSDITIDKIKNEINKQSGKAFSLEDKSCKNN